MALHAVDEGALVGEPVVKNAEQKTIRKAKEDELYLRWRNI
ncbi:UNVERIFIED_ORG: hypothetical protein QOE_2836 [Clostridioides difficile F501]